MHRWLVKNILHGTLLSLYKLRQPQATLHSCTNRGTDPLKSRSRTGTVYPMIHRDVHTCVHVTPSISISRRQVWEGAPKHDKGDAPVLNLNCRFPSTAIFLHGSTWLCWQSQVGSSDYWYWLAVGWSTGCSSPLFRKSTGSLWSSLAINASRSNFSLLLGQPFWSDLTHLDHYPHSTYF